MSYESPLSGKLLLMIKKGGGKTSPSSYFWFTTTKNNYGQKYIFYRTADTESDT